MRSISGSVSEDVNAAVALFDDGLITHVVVRLCHSGARTGDRAWARNKPTGLHAFCRRNQKHNRIQSELMAFLPSSFEVPDPVESDDFLLRSITIHDVIRDFDAVMSSRDHLWARFGQLWGWPAADLTIEQNLVDLGWHQKEFQLRSSFDYVVMTPDNVRQLGCVYIDPSEEDGVDAEIAYWIRSSELHTGLEEKLGTFLRRWIGEQWPFERVIYPYNK